MAVRRIGGNHTLPPNPEWVEFPRTDGNRNTWPTNTTCVVTDGEVNYYRVVGIDESLSIMWRKAVGPKVAEQLGLPSGKAYVLKSFPDGYQLFDHNKGKLESPRHDPYLYGSNRLGKNKFRSVNEFIPHAIWLASNDPLAPCLCKYCSGNKSQKEISQSFGLSTKREGSFISTQSPRQTQRRTAPVTAPKPSGPYTAVRRLPRNVRQTTYTPSTLPAPKQTLALDKSNDIYNALTERDVQRIRYFRKGELVWCALDPPISGPCGDEDAIQFWPGLVDVVTVKSIATNRPETETSENDVPDSASQSGTPPKAKVTWSVKQQTSYKVKLLALSQSYILSDDDVLPYLMYAPSEALLGSLRSALPQALMTDKAQELARSPETNSDYNPLDFSLNPLDRFTDAITPYTLAIQIASHIATYWSPSDEYECKITTVPASSASTQPPPVLTQDGQPPTLQDVLNASLEMNAAVAPRPDGDATQVTRSMAMAQTVTQLRYQGLWWGAERIWTDELVRLKLARCQFAPQGAQAVYPPAGPSKNSKEWYAENGLEADTTLAGAGERGMFMRIEGLFVVNAPRTDGEPGTTKECRASGMLYELVEEDYEDPDSLPQRDAPQVSGKGKERAQEFSESISFGLANAGDSAARSASAPVPGNKDAPRNSSLSRPMLTTPFPLPDPPDGYKFHAILPPGNECVLSLSLISGRYYPRLFKHPLLVPIVQKALQVPVEEGGIMLNKHIWAMEGLLPGAHQSMEPEVWKGSRFLMLRDGDADARNLLGQEIEQICGTAEQPEPMMVGFEEPGPSGTQQDAPVDVHMGDGDAGPSSRP